MVFIPAQIEKKKCQIAFGAAQCTVCTRLSEKELTRDMPRPFLSSDDHRIHRCYSTLMPLVVGYDSDSDDSNEAENIILSSGAGEIKPKTEKVQNEETKTNLSTLNNNKRKAERLQIRIESVQSQKRVDKSKKIKLKAAEKKPEGHSLLNLLPAPKHKNPILAAKRKDDEEVNDFGLQSDPSSSAGSLTLIDSDVSKNKTKANDDFRAMLGLKNSSNLRKGSNVTQEPNFIAQDQEQKQKKSLLLWPEESTSISVVPTPYQPFQRSASSISAAPTVEDQQSIQHENNHEHFIDQQDPYTGWQQGPEGNWFPVTPEAHAQYEKFLFEQSHQKVDGENTLHVGQAHDYHASTINSDIDRKYALAAASVRGSDQSSNHISENNDEGEKKNEKSLNLRAKRKGQLSSLIAQAEEKKDKLEEKWAKGRTARNEAKSKYW